MTQMNPFTGELLPPPSPAMPQKAARLSSLRSLRRASALTPLYSTINTPPTITVTSGTTSPVSGQSYITPTYNWATAGLFTFFGNVATLPPNTAFCTGTNTNYGNAANHPTIGGVNVNSDYMSIRFQTDAPLFDMVVRTAVPTWWDLWIDGYPMYRSGKGIVPTSTANFIKVDWGTDVPAYGVGLIAVTNGGSGHAVGDTVTMTSGSQVVVTSVSGGVITGAQIVYAGSYAATAATFAQSSTTGTGTGLVVTPTQVTESRSTRKLRTYELRLKGSGSYGFAGVNTPMSPQKSVLRAWPACGPRMVAMGDSITTDIFSDGPALGWGSIAAELLGIEDIVTSGCPSQGWTVPIGGLTFGQRLATDLYPLAPSDPSRAFISVWNMGYNDNNGVNPDTAAIQAAVTTAVTGFIINCPNGHLIVMGPWQGYLRSTNTAWAAMETAIQAGCLAAPGWDATKHAFLPIVGKWIIPDDGDTSLASSNSGNTSYYIAQDGTHHGRALDTTLLGPLVADAMRNIIHNVWSL